MRSAGGRKLTLQSPRLTAEQFEMLLEPFLDRDLLYARQTDYRMTCSIFAPLQDALDRSGLDRSDVDYCLLVGGSSLIPQVAAAAAGFFPSARVLTHGDADSVQTAVARGAAYHALVHQGGARPGETVLVLGAAGGVGLAAVEIAKAKGARVIAAASSEAKLAICRERGADAVINYTSEDLRGAIKTHTDGKGPDIIYDPVGGKLAEPAFRSIAWRGRYLVVGFADGEIPALPLNLPLLKGASLVGVFWGEFARREPHHQAAMMQDLFAMLLSQKIRPLISRSYKLADTAQALHAMAARQVTGKIVITP